MDLHPPSAIRTTSVFVAGKDPIRRAGLTFRSALRRAIANLIVARLERGRFVVEPQA